MPTRPSRPVPRNRLSSTVSAWSSSMLPLGQRSPHRSRRRTTFDRVHPRRRRPRFDGPPLAEVVGATSRGGRGGREPGGEAAGRSRHLCPSPSRRRWSKWKTSTRVLKSRRRCHSEYRRQSRIRAAASPDQDEVAGLEHPVLARRLRDASAAPRATAGGRPRPAPRLPATRSIQAAGASVVLAAGPGGSRVAPTPG